MFKIIGNIAGLPSIEEMRAYKLNVVDKVELSGHSAFVDLRYSTQNRAIDVIAEHTGMDKTKVQNVNAPGFQRVDIPQDLIDRIAEIVGVTKPQARLQVLEPGNMVCMHVDDLAVGYMRPIEPGLVGKITFTEQELAKFDEDNYYATRFLIMTEDWQWGQGLMFNDQSCTGWKAGDVLYWDWLNIAHSTFNTGYVPRGLIRITGLRTEKTTRLIEHGLMNKPFTDKV